jgi:hypothetical protein
MSQDVSEPVRCPSIAGRVRAANLAYAARDRSQMGRTGWRALSTDCSAR